MIIETKYFGLVNYDEEEVITFPNGLYGFENAKQFLLLSFDKDDDTMMCFQCVNRPEVAFIVFNPTSIDPIYTPSVSADDKKIIKITSIYNLKFFVIAIVGENFLDTVVNLKCPIILNSEEKIATQIILDSKDYTFRHPVFSNQNGGEVKC